MSSFKEADEAAKKAEADLKAAKERLDVFLYARARDLFPGFDNYPRRDEDSDCVVSQESLLRQALETLREGRTVDETKAKWDAERLIGRMVNIPVLVDTKLRVLASRSGRTKTDIIVEAVSVYLDVLETTKDKAE
jgi:hypothetical protein